MKKKNAWIALLLVLSVFLTGALPVNAASSEEIREEIDALEEKQAQLQAQLGELEVKLSENATEIRQIVTQKQTVDQQVFLLREAIAGTEEQITVYTSLIADRQEQLEKAQGNLAELNEKYKIRIRAMEEEGELSYWSILFDAASFVDFLDRVEMIEEIAAADRRRLQEIREAAEEVAAAKTELETEKTALEDIRQEQLDMQAAMVEKQEQSEALLRQLLALDAEYEALLEEGEAEQDALMQEIAQKEVEFDEAEYREWLEYQAWLESQKPAEPEEPEYTPGEPSESGWITPVPYYTLTSPFGMRLHPILGIYRMHNGVDLSCAEGTEIYASRGGQVTIAKWSDSAGWYVQINHGDGYMSVYMHMTHYVVSEGDYVAPGQVIGYVGDTGLSKGAHLHFGISYNGTYVNPMEYIG